MKKLIFVFLLLISSTAHAQYKGDTFVIDCSVGGFSDDLNRDRISAASMVEGTRNINLHKGGREKRGGTAHVNSTAITGTPRIWGVYQYRTKDGSEYIITATADGKIQKDYTTEIKTGLTINKAVHFVTFNDLLIICTGNDLPEVWNGTGNTSTMSNTPTDWNTSLNYPHKMIKHGRFASERLWAIGGAVDPYTVYASDLSAGDGSTEPDFSDANVVTIHVDTGDGFGIVNAVEYGDRLICSGKDRIYIIDDEDTTVANWGYQKSQWEGGTANSRSLVAVSNEIISLTEDGTIYAVSAAQEYGDYKNASIARTVFIDQWIRDNIELSLISNFHVVYDPVLRCVYFFMIRSGQTSIDTALVYFIDRGPEQGWMIHDNLSNTSGYSASCSALVRKSAGDSKVYTGGWSGGYVWELQVAAKSDNLLSFPSGFKTPRFHLGDPRTSKRFDIGWIVTTATALNSNLSIDIWVDGKYFQREIVDITGNTAVYGTAIYGESYYGGTELVVAAFDIGKEGRKIELHVSNNNSGEDFFVTMMMLDFKNLGRIVR